MTGDIKCLDQASASSPWPLCIMSSSVEDQLTREYASGTKHEQRLILHWWPSYIQLLHDFEELLQTHIHNRMQLSGRAGTRAHTLCIATEDTLKAMWQRVISAHIDSLCIHDMPISKWKMGLVRTEV
jgi:hypothetical protein